MVRRFRGPIGSEIRDLVITAAGEVAFCHCLHCITGTRASGGETRMWVRVTVGLRKIDGAWKVTHEHVSVPLHMDGSNRAAIDLEP